MSKCKHCSEGSKVSDRLIWALSWSPCRGDGDGDMGLFFFSFLPCFPLLSLLLRLPMPTSMVWGTERGGFEKEG